MRDTESRNIEWTTVDRFFHPTDAHIAAGRLESEGIPVFLLGINHASVNWLLSNALGGIRLQVPAQYVDEARAILADTIQASSEQNDSCPNCGSNDTSAMSNSRKIAFLAVHLFSLPVPWRNSRRHCQACGAEWSVKA
jgi:hypothetical protein